MPRTAGRSPEQTRRLVLDAAAAVVRRTGPGATLDAVAAEAGLSKGGLVYHFASKETLLLALAEDQTERFRAAVEAADDPDDGAPGRLTRAYVRTCLDEPLDPHGLRDDILLTAQLMTIPAVRELAHADQLRWERDLAADGLPQDVVELVLAAADGASAALLWGGEVDAARLRRLQSRLVAMTREPTRWSAP
ncbi:TetR/AcrR family transcriptional regulator [Janibacter melonis]|uniref:TetR/AcrR family transcriptional regulator n=1 Tax=Janibacter melonis TaxID=262209 RepID=UPI0019188977|nr:TetR/AcrR family transcriptional regulator [Janibacter melonis]